MFAELRATGVDTGSMPAYRTRRRARRVSGRLALPLLLLGLGALATRNLSWGLPEMWPYDENIGRVRRMLREGTLNPQYFVNPSLGINAAWLPSRVLQAVGWRRLGLDPGVGVGLTCRLASVAFYLLGVVFAARTIALVFGRERALFAAVFVGTMGVLVHHAHLATVNSCFFFTVVYGVYRMTRVLVTRRECDFYLAAAACGLAVGAKYNALFLMAGLPVVWVSAMGSALTLRTLRAFATAGLVAAATFVFTTPFALLDSRSFARDFQRLVQLEAPAFQGDAGPREYIWQLWRYGLGAFSPLTVALAAAMTAVASFLAVRRRGRSVRPVEPNGQFQLRVFFALLLTLSVAFHAMNFRIDILASRFYVPGLLLGALAFLGVFYWLKDVVRAAAGRYALSTAGVLLGLSGGVNSWAHVEAFASSHRDEALRVLSGYLREDPSARIGVAGLRSRSPFQRGVIDAHCDFFVFKPAPRGLASMSDYLDQMVFYFDRRPRYLVLEKALTSARLFRPRQYARNPSMRLQYHNLGLRNWEARLRRAGYERRAEVRARHPRWMERVLGPYHHWTAEGAGGANASVLVYERRAADASRPVSEAK